MKRADRNKLKIKTRVEPALRSVMQPDEQIIAGVWARQGRGLAAEKIVGLSAAALAIYDGVQLTLGGQVDSGLALVVGLFAGMMASWLAVLRRPVFVAVTTRQQLCVKVGRTDHWPTGPVVAEPIPGVRALLGHKLLGERALRLTSADGRHTRLAVPWWWRSDLARFLSGLQVAGATVTGPIADLGPAQVIAGPVRGLPVAGTADSLP